MLIWQYPIFRGFSLINTCPPSPLWLISSVLQCSQNTIYFWRIRSCHFQAMSGRNHFSSKTSSNKVAGTITSHQPQEQADTTEVPTVQAKGGMQPILPWSIDQGCLSTDWNQGTQVWWCCRVSTEGGSKWSYLLAGKTGGSVTAST